jgi:predicted negative regulator of RcsB-dependent stress response
MIKFFRKIRQKMLIENKTGKYFKYAIGEIILVVIGILIALQINNWNENRLEKIEEQSFLSNLHNEFSQNKKALKTALEMFDTSLKADKYRQYSFPFILL